MAEIAAIFHWPLAEIAALDMTALLYWRNAAVRAWNRMNVPAKGR